MRKSLILIGSVLFIGMLLNGCSTMKMKPVHVPEKVVFSKGLEKKIEELNAPMAIVVLPDGNVAAYDKDGGPLESCVYPSSMGQKASNRVCKGFSKEKEVVSVNTVTIIKSKGSGCITYVDMHGNLLEYCW